MAEKKRFQPVVKKEWCKACGVCIEFCPKKIFATDTMEKPVVQMSEECTGCEMCRWRCPGLAITVVERWENR